MSNFGIHFWPRVTLVSLLKYGYGVICHRDFNYWVEKYINIVECLLIASHIVVESELQLTNSSCPIHVLFQELTERPGGPKTNILRKQLFDIFTYGRLWYVVFRRQ
jgi:hypothetical protein